MSIHTNCDFERGIMSVWLGSFAEPEDFYRYVQTCFCSDREEDLDPEYVFAPAEFRQRLEALFRPEYGDRPEEDQLRAAFREHYNRFEYDFGILIDEDFAVCDYCEEPTHDLGLLLEEWPELLIPMRQLIQDTGFDQAVNCIFAVPSCGYRGTVRHVSPEGGELWFVGNMHEEVFSDTVAEEYHKNQNEAQ
ncbi:MAG: hypothetical protein KH009_01270 [Clostridiales bacterium]|nr:hypothetical protein [Clostridiales bacterium]